MRLFTHITYVYIRECYLEVIGDRGGWGFQSSAALANISQGICPTRHDGARGHAYRSSEEGDYTQMHMRRPMTVRMRKHAHIHIHTYIRLHTYTPAHVHTYTRITIYMHTHLHTRTHTCTHAQYRLERHNYSIDLPFDFSDRQAYIGVDSEDFFLPCERSQIVHGILSQVRWVLAIRTHL